jgi:hypothetical protein
MQHVTKMAHNPKPRFIFLGFRKVHMFLRIEHGISNHSKFEIKEISYKQLRPFTMITTVGMDHFMNVHLRVHLLTVLLSQHKKRSEQRG